MHIMNLGRSRLILAAIAVAAPFCFAGGSQPAPAHAPAALPGRGSMDVIQAANIVNLDGSVMVPKNFGTTTIYSVPSDKYLVVTDVEFDSSGVIDLMAGAVVKRSFPFTDPATAFHSSVGLAFPPSSTIVLRNSAGGFGSDFCNFSLTGHLMNP